MSDFRARLLKEQEELLERINKLSDFTITDAFSALPQIEKEDLREQCRHMRSYHRVLSKRVSRLCNNN